MKIGQLAQTTGLSTKTIRYYEDIGVLPEPERQVNGYRIYGKTVVDRLAFIRDAQASGLSLIEIQWILELRDEGKSTCGHTISLLESHLDDVEKQMTELDRTKKRLIRIIDRAKSLDPAECNDPDRCQTISHFKVE
jgi:DNA-binding transcriptional MerR regulator